MASELNMYQRQAAEYKYKIERFGREFQDYKRKHLEQKKAEQRQRERRRAEHATENSRSFAAPIKTGAKYAASAYNLSQHA
eukprot:Clim_evm6s5 gene=Clim_evmTU6s5